MDASSSALETYLAMRHLSDYWIGSKHTHVFTDTVRGCKRVFELVLAGFGKLTANPFANPFAKWSSGSLLSITRTEVAPKPTTKDAVERARVGVPNPYEAEFRTYARRRL